MFYVIELQKPACLPAYVVEQADTTEDARAVCDARLGREERNDDVQIVAVHPIQ